MLYLLFEFIIYPFLTELERVGFLVSYFTIYYFFDSYLFWFDDKLLFWELLMPLGGALFEGIGCPIAFWFEFDDCPGIFLFYSAFIFLAEFIFLICYFEN